MDKKECLKEKIKLLEQIIELQKQLLATKAPSYPVYVPYPYIPYQPYPDPWHPYYTSPVWTGTTAEFNYTDGGYTPTITSTTIRGGHNA